MNKRFLILMATIMLAGYSLTAQVSINTDGSDPDGSAMLDVKSNDKGMLVPRMTSQQRIDINTPATGLLVFDITTGSFWFYNNEWTDLSASAGTWTVNGNNISAPNTGNVGIGTTAPESLLHLWGNGSYGAGSRLIFGDDLNLGGTRAYIAEWGWQTDTDSDILELSGNNGLKFTTGSSSLFTEMEITQDHNVGIGTSSGPEPSAKLDVESTTQGFLTPRMTSQQRIDIDTPATGLLVFDITTESFWFYNNGWTDLSAVDDGAWTVNGNHISAPNTGNVGIGTTYPASLLHLWGNGLNGAGSRLAFGDDLASGGSTRAYIAEWGWQTNQDSDKLELSGYKGIKFTSGSSSEFTDMEIAEEHNVGIGTISGPEPSAKLDVESTTQGFLPPRMTEEQRDEITATAGLMVFNTSTNKPNYYNGTEWRNYDGTTAEPSIGDSYGGGIVAYIFQNGDPGYVEGEKHGLIASKNDLSNNLIWMLHEPAPDPWFYLDEVIVPGDATSLTDGMANSNAIVAQGGLGDTYAAGLCRTYSAPGDGDLNDWYLPSKWELNKLYLNKYAIGNFDSYGSYYCYWSSTEFDNNDAWRQWFDSGTQSDNFKNSTYRVRAVRAF